MDPGTETADALRLGGVTFAYRCGLLRTRRPVLHGVDLTVSHGERVGLIGPNGSGKSTLLRIAAGVQRPSGGAVSVLGGSVDDARARERVGYLTDGSPFPPELSARSVLELFGALHGLARRERARRADELLERTGLRGDARRSLSTFSRGMLRRFGLAQAFLGTPDLLLLDEPTSGLDAPGHTVLEELLAEASARGAALLLASHVPTDLLAFTDRVAVLVEGRITREGTPEELLGTCGGGRSMGELYAGPPAS